MWSIGVILYAMLAGNLPFGKDLLNCPRFAELKEWHARKRGRTSRPVFELDYDEEEFENSLRGEEEEGNDDDAGDRRSSISARPSLTPGSPCRSTSMPGSPCS